MKVKVAQHEDIASWLCLAAEVEYLFGPMVNEPKFIEALERNIKRGSAFCIRECDGSPGSRLLAGILFSAKPPQYKVGWLVVTKEKRRLGLGTLLLTHVMRLVQTPAEVTVKTFGPDVRDGEAARRFYLEASFETAEMTHDGPQGAPVQVFRKKML